MKNITLRKPLNLKDGTVIAAGETVTFIRPGEHPAVGVWDYKGREMKLRYRNVVKAPSIRTLEKWEGEGYCKSVFGERTETDGYGSHGEPSWCLAYGLI
jgi:hypothetical protein